MRHSRSPSSAVRASRFGRMGGPRGHLFLSVFKLNVNVLLYIVNCTMLHCFGPSDALNLCVSMATTRGIRGLGRSIPGTSIRMMVARIRILSMPVRLLRLGNLHTRVDFVRPSATSAGMFFCDEYTSRRMSGDCVKSVIMTNRRCRGSHSHTKCYNVINGGVILNISCGRSMGGCTRGTGKCFFHRCVLIDSKRVPHGFCLRKGIRHYTVKHVKGALCTMGAGFPRAVSTFTRTLHRCNFASTVCVANNESCCFCHSTSKIHRSINSVGGCPRRRDGNMVP